ncbi:hypothetical protein [Paraferrimonas sp. SM1919]|uniref:hypothetical protein n=1 Tax=Paraferrimonas sp. SM1919 TaxID=2662263 RepID=UPI001969AFD5|nr:hypothetical protein [Paraferrimonas sp. SM1919]
MTQAAVKTAKAPNHPFFSLVIMVAIAGIATYFIPAGEFARTVVDGKTVIDPESYRQLESNPTTLIGFLQWFYSGF